MSSEANTTNNPKRPLEDFGRKLDREISDSIPKIEAEVKKVISYLNDKVVPEVRNQSSRALRAASEQLARLANALDDQKKQ